MQGLPISGVNKFWYCVCSSQIFAFAALIDGITGVIMGLVPNNWVFIALMLVQGMCDNSQAVGYSLLADCKQALK